ncbi:MAG: hypothetical protein PHT69_01190 [Bacteroidales bacterium]|nr:hypothetical protein [Bacteroidales bacterium]
MCTSSIVFILLLLAKILGFIGLVVLIYGFKNNTLGTIKKGTILVSIAILFASISMFMITKKCLKHYKNKVKSIDMIMEHACCSPFSHMQHGNKSHCQDEQMTVSEEGDSICIKTEVIKIEE